MLSLSINLIYWDDCLPNSTRLRNVKYIINELKNLNLFLKEEIDSEINIIDYSKKQILEGSKHVPYADGVYKRSEKINRLLYKCDKDLFGVIDADCFLKKVHYKTFRDSLLNNGKNCCYTYDVCDFSAQDTEQILYNYGDPDTLPVTNRFPGRTGGLGAFFITDTVNLKKHNGFDEKFTTWGGEDGEIYGRIQRDNKITKVATTYDKITLYHLNHFSNRSDIRYFNNDEYIRNNF
tara:strand:+ start:137 stop:841 length:705 start_codon:yes stop_codon:yes gene_type:complete